VTSTDKHSPPASGAGTRPAGDASRVDTSIPVVVLAWAHGSQDASSGSGALGVARTLGRLGVPAYLVHDRGVLPVSFSRYWKGTFAWDPSAPPDESLRFLAEIGRRAGGRPLLLQTTDPAAIFVADHAGVLEERFEFPRVSPTLIRGLANKWQMFLAAKQSGVPTPETILPRSRDDVVRFLDEGGARFPLLLKGADPLGPGRWTMKIVHTARDLLELYERAGTPGVPDVMIQEYIPGGDDAVWMCNAYFDRQSECRAVFTGRKLRQWPAHTGVASLAICAPNETVAETTRRFMKAVGYQGPVGIGYRYDARDGLYKLLDINARVSGVFRLFTAPNGMDVVRVCYLDLTGQAIPPFSPRAGRKWMLEEDVLTAATYVREGKLTPWQWLASLRGVEETQWFWRDDPVPGLVWCWKRLPYAERSCWRMKRLVEMPWRRMRRALGAPHA